MLKNKKYFTKGQYLFWVLILLLTSFAFLHLADKMFTEEGIVERIIDGVRPPDIDTTFVVETDTINNKLNDSMLLTWEWKDFYGLEQKVEFSYQSNFLELSKRNREVSYSYDAIYNHDKKLLSDLILKLKNKIEQNKFNYIQAIEYICSSIQYIPYTLVLNSKGIEYPVESGKFVHCPCQTNFGYFNDNCKSLITGNGCCNNVDPFGVYAPFEFVYKKTGDCDTRALLAFTLLKQMGFDVAVMVSIEKYHSVLGVYLPNAGNYSYGTNLNGKKYALWELTSPDWRFGMGVNGDDWYAALE